MNAHLILWIYIGLMLLGGLMGFIKAGSKASLIASASFAAVLCLFAVDLLAFRYHTVVLAILFVFFGVRLAKAKKMMPNGLMLILTGLTLAGTTLF